MRHRTLLAPIALFALSALFSPSALSAQSLSFGAARWLSSPRLSEYRLGVDGLWWDGAVGFRPSIQLLTRGGESRAGWGGLGTDVILRATRDARPYLIGGAGLGLGRPDSLGGLGPALGLWGGLGAELVSFGALALQAEALYSWRARVGVSSVSLGIRGGMRIGRLAGGRGPSAESRVPSAESRAPSAESRLPTASPEDEAILRRAISSPSAPSAPSALSASVVASALAAMGTPYRWGGSDENGFDCSGLIQYAYAQHGVELPRRSGDQARAGLELGRALEQLAPGDILTFAPDAARAGAISHVGLYLGEGRFIHSATGGVQVSVLSPTDPVGRWWWDRWVGARRVAGT